MESFSQFGEDGLVWRHFGRKRDGFFVEIGANDPCKFSQTWLLEQNGWTGILVEPLPGPCERLRAERKNSRVFQVAVGAPEQKGRKEIHVPADDMYAALNSKPQDKAILNTLTVSVTTLDDVLAEAGNPAVDYLSIDVEGMELDVLRGFDLSRHHPALILVEDHLRSLAVYLFLARRGYQLAKRTGCNNWFVVAGTRFELTGALERLQLWKRLWIHTPLGIVRKKLRNLRKRIMRG